MNALQQSKLVEQVNDIIIQHFSNEWRGTYKELAEEIVYELITTSLTHGESRSEDNRQAESERGTV